MKKMYCCVITLSVITGALAGYLNGVTAISMIEKNVKVSSLLRSRAKKAFKTMQKKVNL